MKEGNFITSNRFEVLYDKFSVCDLNPGITMSLYSLCKERKFNDVKLEETDH